MKRVPIVSVAEMRAAEQSAITDGCSAESLMEAAGLGIARAVGRWHPGPGTCIVFAGKGNNAGDGFVAARHLAEAGWRVDVRLAFPVPALGPLAREKWEALQNATQALDPAHCDIALDALLGIGSGGPLRAPILDAARELRRLRESHAVRIHALDLPTGLDADTGEVQPDAVVADVTHVIGFPKRGLLADAATGHVGRLVHIPIPVGNGEPFAQRAELSTAASLRHLVPLRGFDTHKGEWGRVAILAGSNEMPGAASMASSAAVRAGAGLVTLFTPCKNAVTMPEVMVRNFQNIGDLMRGGFDAIAVGPGLGRTHNDAVRTLIEQYEGPLVLDADGINALAGDPEPLSRPAGPRLLTPHPGEMERLWPREGRSRADWAASFVKECPATLLLKGARTVVAEAQKPHACNSTGTPGMATGGMGDVLTGVCVALAARGLSMFDSARLAAWLCGRAGELAVLGGESEESLCATDLVRHLGGAFHSLRREDF